MIKNTPVWLWLSAIMLFVCTGVIAIVLLSKPYQVASEFSSSANPVSANLPNTLPAIYSNDDAELWNALSNRIVIFDPQEREDALRLWLHSLTDKEFATLKRWLPNLIEKRQSQAASKNSPGMLVAIDIILNELGGREGRAGLIYFDQLNLPLALDFLRQHVFTGWWQRDRSAVLTFLEQDLKGESHNTKQAAAISQLFLDQDPEGFFAWLMTRPINNNDRLTQEMLQIVANTPDSRYLDRAGLVFDRFGMPADGASSIEAFARNLAEDNPSKALSWAMQRSNESVAEVSITAALSQIAVQDPNQALAILDGRTFVATRPRLMELGSRDHSVLSTTTYHVIRYAIDYHASDMKSLKTFYLATSHIADAALLRDIEDRIESAVTLNFTRAQVDQFYSQLSRDLVAPINSK